MNLFQSLVKLEDFLLLTRNLCLLVFTLAREMLIALSELIKLSVSALELSQSGLIELLSLDLLPDSHAESRIQLICDLLCEAFLLVCDEFLQGVVPLFEVLRHLLAIGTLV